MMSVSIFRLIPKFLLLVTILPALAPAQLLEPDRTNPPDPTRIVDQLVQRTKARAAALKRYEGCRYYSLNYSGFPGTKSAGMMVEASYKAPAEKHFRVVREDGSKFLVHHVLKELLEKEKEAFEEENQTQIALTPDNYNFRLAGTDTFYGRPQYVMELMPRSSNKFLYRGKIWVDATDFAVTRISAEPAKNPSVWISHTRLEHEYQKKGEFWLPARNSTVSTIRLGGLAKLNIQYLNYFIGETKVPDGGTCSNAPQISDLSP